MKEGEDCRCCEGTMLDKGDVMSMLSSLRTIASSEARQDAIVATLAALVTAPELTICVPTTTDR